ncbi:helix-turn-helix domain-containing protein [Methylobacterium mesophilicum SR1.6/6]|uniref:Helix-turn-helix domain-containing protein n=1 Tax=Methylobacterium mesophilicum SR1.6/6 TaxID=908290 RepID=A0A6B9FUN0_9HYPH|nr:helix-turn-helix domain-containing protein [Methylobacterium mesophilicum]MBE7247442.1 helix-turn-helix domain-containing protein [Actinomycetospora chiangmaiensis]QGY04808.1 helix-turn-helix domain-containing protein [Methylobacterium mesophilicum SR1.6/6]
MTFVPRSHFTTASLPERDRFEAWRALFSAHDLDADPQGFSGKIETTLIGSLALRVMNAAPQGPGRSRSRIRRDGQDGFVLHLSRHAYSVETERGVIDVPAGAISLNDLSQPYRRSRVPETDSLIVALPRASVASVLPDEDTLHGLILQGGAGRLLADHVRSLAAHSHAIATVDAAHVAQATLHMLAACARPSLESIGRAGAPLDAVRLRAAKQLLRRQLSTPLRIDALAKTLGMSRSQLYRLFEPEGGVAHYLARQRLAAVRAALDEPLERRSIGEIGEAFGFGSSAVLSRAFRQAYGLSPRDYRASVGGA